jgi:hypothetical protein
MNENETGASPFSGGGSMTAVSNTHVQDARCNNYDIPYVKSGTPIRPISRREEPRDRLDSRSLAESATTRYNLRRWAVSAKEAAERLRDASRSEDFMEATSAGVQLTYYLSQLWHSRDKREPEYAEVVSMLQLALAKVNFESVSVCQCDRIIELLDKCLLSGIAEETEVRLARSLLREAGFDPFRGLSFREGLGLD